MAVEAVLDCVCEAVGTRKARIRRVDDPAIAGRGLTVGRLADAADRQRVAVGVGVVGQYIQRIVGRIGIDGEQVVRGLRCLVGEFDLALGHAGRGFLVTVVIDDPLVADRIPQRTANPWCFHGDLDLANFGGRFIRADGHCLGAYALGYEADFYPAVSTAVLFPVVGKARLGLAFAAPVDLTWIDALCSQVIDHGAGASLAQTLIIGLRAKIAGVSDDLDIPDQAAVLDHGQ